MSIYLFIRFFLLNTKLIFFIRLYNCETIKIMISPQVTYAFSRALECSICRTPKVRKIIMYPCNHDICHICITRIQNKCPMCKRTIIAKVDFMGDKFFGTKVTCPYKECSLYYLMHQAEPGKGMTPEELQNHLDNECKFSEILCDCSNYFARIDWDSHWENECPERIDVCKLCNRRIKGKYMDNHIKNTCLSANLKCPEIGCEYITERLNIDSHRKECEFRKVICSVSGCKNTGSFMRMKDHLAICKSQKCERCGLIRPSTKMEDHENSCNQKIINCPMCKEKMIIGAFAKHFSSAHENDVESQLKEKKQIDEDKAVEQYWNNLTKESFLSVYYNNGWTLGYISDTRCNGIKKICVLILNQQTTTTVWISNTKYIREYTYYINLYSAQDRNLGIIINNLFRLDIDGGWILNKILDGEKYSRIPNFAEIILGNLSDAASNIDNINPADEHYRYVHGSSEILNGNEFLSMFDPTNVGEIIINSPNNHDRNEIHISIDRSDINNSEHDESDEEDLPELEESS